MQKSEDSDSESGPYPPIPVPDTNLGSPYENVRPDLGRRGRFSGRSNTISGMESSPGSSPVQHWDSYSQKKSETT